MYIFLHNSTPNSRGERIDAMAVPCRHACQTKRYATDQARLIRLPADSTRFLRLLPGGIRYIISQGRGSEKVKTMHELDATFPRVGSVNMLACLPSYLSVFRNTGNSTILRGAHLLVLRRSQASMAFFQSLGPFFFSEQVCVCYRLPLWEIMYTIAFLETY